MWLCSQLALYTIQLFKKSFTCYSTLRYSTLSVTLRLVLANDEFCFILYWWNPKPVSLTHICKTGHVCTLFSTVNPPSPYFWDSFKFPNEGFFYISIMHIMGWISVSRKTSFGFQGGTSDFGVLLPCVRINLHLTSCRRSQRSHGQITPVDGHRTLAAIVLS